MALADYFRRSAVAVAQVVQGYDEDQLRELLDSKPVGISLGDIGGPEGEALSDLAVRLLSRLYPRLAIAASEPKVAAGYVAVAESINPNIEVVDGPADIAISIGSGAPEIAPETIYAGSFGWTALLSECEPRPIGEAPNPFGAGAAAALAAANVFRRIVLGDKAALDSDLAYSTFWNAPSSDDPAASPETDVANAVLVGGGAIGNAVAWALSRAPLTGQLHIVDAEAIELSNLQRYVLTSRSDEGAPKVDLLASKFVDPVTVHAHPKRWEEFAESSGYHWDYVLVGLDSAAARRAVQASLPRTIVNAWTQPGDLGVSVHPGLEAGACLTCLYRPAGAVPNEDQLVADALGIDHTAHGVLIRQLLEAGAPAPRHLLDMAAEHLQVPPEEVLAFEQRPLRDLYVEGVCGGALIPLDRLGIPNHDLHVPLAHQSALAGVLLAAQFVRLRLGEGPSRTAVTRLNVLRRVPAHPTQASEKSPDGGCICQDPVYLDRYAGKYIGE